MTDWIVQTKTEHVFAGVTQAPSGRYELLLRVKNGDSWDNPESRQRWRCATITGLEAVAVGTIRVFGLALRKDVSTRTALAVAAVREVVYQAEDELLSKSANDSPTP